MGVPKCKFELYLPSSATIFLKFIEPWPDGKAEILERVELIIRVPKIDLILELKQDLFLKKRKFLN